MCRNELKFLQYVFCGVGGGVCVCVCVGGGGGGGRGGAWTGEQVKGEIILIFCKVYVGSGQGNLWKVRLSKFLLGVWGSGQGSGLRDRSTNSFNRSVRVVDRGAGGGEHYLEFQQVVYGEWTGELVEWASSNISIMCVWSRQGSSWSGRLYKIYVQCVWQGSGQGRRWRGSI